MSKRQSQHHGRSAGDERGLPGRDMAGPTDAGDDALEAVEAAREISRVLDREEGYDRAEPRSASARGGAARGKKGRG